MSRSSVPARLGVEEEVVVLLLLCVSQKGLVGVAVIGYHFGNKLEEYWIINMKINWY